MEGTERGGNKPVECPSQHQVVVNIQFVQSICEVALVDEPTGFVNYYQSVDDPASTISPLFRPVSQSRGLHCASSCFCYCAGYVRWQGSLGIESRIERLQSCSCTKRMLIL